MTVFICHSSRDDAAVRMLVQHLQAAHESVWLDQSLIGGEDWWARILNQIRSCQVFVVALSNNCLQSKPCRAELTYAKALGLPVLPVMVGDVDSYRIDPIFTMQSVDYRDPDVTSGLALITALRERAATRTDLPDPLPDPPPIPYEYLQRLGVAIDSPEDLTPTEQSTIISALRRALRDEDDDTVQADIRSLLRALRRRSEVTYANVSEIDALLRTDSASTAHSVVADKPSGDDAAVSDGGASDPAEDSPAETAGTSGTSKSLAPSTARTSPKLIIAASVVALVGVAIGGFFLLRPKPADGSAIPPVSGASPATGVGSAPLTTSAAETPFAQAGKSPPASPVAGMMGSWGGMAQSSDGTSFPISLDINQLCEIGQLCGSISVPQVPCYGQVFLESVASGEVEFRVANFDQRSNQSECQEGAGEHFQLLPNGNLGYRTSYEPIAKGELKKQ